MDKRRREITGSFYTPQIWVELSQKYLADVLGENWQDEYYIWDCAAGTGNLLTGLTHKYNIWASTLDKQDVDVMHDRIKNGANLLEDHVFQFDFLNDEFTKLPLPLQNIINDPEKRKKLVLYINPPYAEVSSIGTGKGKKGVNLSVIHKKYSDTIGTAGRELFAIFLTRVFVEINGCYIGEFSTLKAIQGSAFDKFRALFKAELLKTFIVPSYTFDNVNGSFPIGFKIWNTHSPIKNENTITIDVYDEKGKKIKEKTIRKTAKLDYINKWISSYKNDYNNFIGFLAGTNGNDFQTNKMVYIINKKEQMPNPRGIWINTYNILAVAVYCAVRHCIKHIWQINQDQFLYPNDGWEKDTEFQNDCFAYTLFKNNIQSKYGTNHWIPFTEEEVNAREKFESNFMTSFIKGKIQTKATVDLFGNREKRNYPLAFSSDAKAVLDAGRELWKYYHKQPNCNVNASLYDIREYFQKRNEAGKMNNKSKDETYTKLIDELRETLKQLAKKIEPKVYEYGFLKE